MAGSYTFCDVLLHYLSFIAILSLKLIVKYFVQPLHSSRCDVILLQNCQIGRIRPIIISIILFIFTNEYVLGVEQIRCRSKSLVEPENKQDVNTRCFTIHGLPVGFFTRTVVELS